jgi:hypothetical protein
MAANLMDLVRELKSLNARKKGGETLSAADEARRKELKAFLRTTLEAQGGASGEESAVKEQPTRNENSRPAAPRPERAAPAPVAQAPAPVAAAAPRPVTVSAPQPTQMPGSAHMPGTQMPGSAPAPVPAAAPAPYVPKKNAYAIDAGLADALIGNAMKSEAVNKVDPFANRKAHASQAELDESAEKADAAIRANKKKPRAEDPDAVIAQLKETEAAYTPSENALTFEQYYGDYQMDGYQIIEAHQAPDLKPIDPRQIELQKAGLDSTGMPGAGAATLTVPSGLAFIDDFPALYTKRILPPPSEEVVADSNDPSLIVPGKRKVTVHLLNGEKRQGTLRLMRRGDLGFKLEPLGSGLPEEVSISQCKAVFIHLNTNAQPPAVAGRNLTVTFRDGRAAQGVSDDYQPGTPVFSIVPPAGRGQFERVIVNGAFVQSVS